MKRPTEQERLRLVKTDSLSEMYNSSTCSSQATTLGGSPVCPDAQDPHELPPETQGGCTHPEICCPHGYSRVDHNDSGHYCTYCSQTVHPIAQCFDECRCLYPSPSPSDISEEDEDSRSTSKEYADSQAEEDEDSRSTSKEYADSQAEEDEDSRSDSSEAPMRKRPKGE